MIIFLPVFILANTVTYIQKSNELKLFEDPYWYLLLHMKDGVSEIDDEKFFISKNGKNNAKLELESTIHALLNETRFDDNATACKFPARKTWIVEKLQITDLPKVLCKAYEKVFVKLAPTSASIVFPSAHINSPASMFGHTFLRINSRYQSTLLSYAINYAANIDESKTNGFSYAIHGLTGGYRGFYSMLPYYEKLKEYRDSEQRDIWEYDLNLTQNQVIRMFQHIWELNGIYSDYYFFTENCSYNILWLLEIARPSMHLRKYFTYHVSPLETIHAMKDEGLITHETFRDSKRNILLKYEKEIDDAYIHYVKALVFKELVPKKVLDIPEVSIQQKRYIFEASIELLEFIYMQGKIEKSQYLKKFHKLTTARAMLGMGEELNLMKPKSPLNAHRQARITIGLRESNNKMNLLLGIRPVYHDLEDNNGLLRGTQIEFLNTLFRIDKNTIKIEEFTLLSIASISQISEFIQPLSWRTHFKWDRDYMNDDFMFNMSIGAGSSWGNTYGYTYFMSDILGYIDKKIVGGMGLSVGVVIDKSNYFKTNIEATQRWYTNGKTQQLLNVIQSYASTENTQFKFEYKYKSKTKLFPRQHQYKMLFNYYF